MISNKSVVAVIPVRAGSRRLPNKNILPFGDSNLLVHKIRQLKSVPAIDSVVVFSDSDIMLQKATDEGVLTHKRALEFADDKTRSFNDVIVNVVSALKGDIIMWTPCVCPLLSPETYKRAIEKYEDSVIKNKANDSLISVRLFKEYLWDDKKPINYSLQKEHVISQNLPDWYLVTNGIYMANKDFILQQRYFFGKNPYKFVVSKREAIDIDDAEDFAIAKALLGIEKTR